MPLLAACVVDHRGEFSTLSGGGTGTGGDTTGFVGDPEPCTDDPPCDDPIEDCCPANQLPTTLAPAACPSPGFPNNWKCSANKCKQQFDDGPVGCNTAIIDQTECRAPGFVCREINNVGHCVLPCTDDDDCQADTTCETVDTVTFCMQVIP